MEGKAPKKCLGRNPVVESFIRKEIEERNNFRTEIMEATAVAMNGAKINY